jgi:hypothetical protein
VPKGAVLAQYDPGFRKDAEKLILIQELERFWWRGTEDPRQRKWFWHSIARLFGWIQVNCFFSGNSRESGVSVPEDGKLINTIPRCHRSGFSGVLWQRKTSFSACLRTFLLP